MARMNDGSRCATPIGEDGGGDGEGEGREESEEMQVFAGSAGLLEVVLDAWWAGRRAGEIEGTRQRGNEGGRQVVGFAGV